MSDTTPGVPATTGFGVAFVLAGGALLLQEWDLLTIRWTFLLPVMITVVGVVVLLSGLTGAHRSRPARVPPGADGPAALDEPPGHDLQGHDLQGHDLQGHDLQGHDLQGHDLQGHDLQGHDLQGFDHREGHLQ